MLPLAIVAIIAFAIGAADGHARVARQGRRRALHRGLGERRIRGHVQGAEPGLQTGDLAQRLRRRLPRRRTRRRRVALARSRLARRPATPKTAPRRAGDAGERDRRLRRFEAEVELPYDEGGIAWDPSLVFPGLERGEHLESEIELAPRAPILAADGTALAEGEADAREHPIGSAAIDVTGEVGEAEEEDLPALERQGFSATTPVGVSGLEQAFNARLAGKPGGSLLAVPEAGGSGRGYSPRASRRPGRR